jgi:hypothetical protein
MVSMRPRDWFLQFQGDNGIGFHGLNETVGSDTSCVHIETAGSDFVAIFESMISVNEGPRGRVDS